MKPSLSIIVSAAALCCSVSTAAAQTPVSIWSSGPEALSAGGPSTTSAAASLWGTPPPLWSAPLPAADLWHDYAQDPIACHLKAPCGRVCIRDVQPVKCLAVTLCGLIDSIFPSPHRAGKCSTCRDCASASSMPTLAEPARLPQPPGSVVTDDLPMLPQPEDEPSPPQISRPSPTLVVEGTPPQPLDRPEEPKLIHGPVVEAAPEFVFPPDVPPSPPRNVIPAPGAFPPRNTIPAQ